MIKLAIPARFVSLAKEWHDGQADVLYEVASTGHLTVREQREWSYHFRRSLTDDESTWKDWMRLSSKVFRAWQKADKGNHPDRNGLLVFNTWVDIQADRLAAVKGLEVEHI